MNGRYDRKFLFLLIARELLMVATQKLHHRVHGQITHTLLRSLLELLAQLFCITNKVKKVVEAFEYKPGVCMYFRNC